MHLETFRGSERLVADHKSDVRIANYLDKLYDLLGISGVVCPLGYDASAANWRFTDGGEFPKVYSAENTQLCLQALAEVTGEAAEEIEEKLRQASPSPLNDAEMGPIQEIVTAAFVQHAVHNRQPTLPS